MTDFSDILESEEVFIGVLRYTLDLGSSHQDYIFRTKPYDSPTPAKAAVTRWIGRNKTRMVAFDRAVMRASEWEEVQ